MSIEWSELLAESGLSRNDDVQTAHRVSVSHEADTPQLVDLSDLSVIEATGSEVSTFLQGQFCNDFQQVSLVSAQITGYCTPKGRLLALPIVLASADAYRLLVPESVAESFLKRLSMFVLRADVKLSLREDLLCVGLISDQDAGIGEAETLVGTLPEELLGVHGSDNAQCVRWHDDYSSERTRRRFIRIASVSEQMTLWRACSSLVKTSSENWQLADIAAGVPSVTPGVSESFVPQMLNMHLINGLSFTKGCYPGQEIVARMQYLGKLKRHMRLFEFDASSQVPEPGFKLTAGSDQDAGIVVNAIADAGGEGLLLAVVKVALDNQELRVSDLLLKERALPYELPSGMGSTEQSAEC